MRVKRYISFSASIDAENGQALVAELGRAIEQDVDEVHLLLSTDGGQITEALRLYNLLRAMPFRLITHNVGAVRSAGNPIFLAGDERRACPASSFLFHDVTWNGGSNISADYVLAAAGALRSDEDQIVEIVAARTHFTKREARALHHGQTTLSARRARQVGIIDRVCSPHIPAGAGLVYIPAGGRVTMQSFGS